MEAVEECEERLARPFHAMMMHHEHDEGGEEGGSRGHASSSVRCRGLPPGTTGWLAKMVRG